MRSGNVFRRLYRSQHGLHNCVQSCAEDLHLAPKKECFFTFFALSSPPKFPQTDYTPCTMAPITTPITELLGIKHPILLAGMGHTAGPDLVAAVSNAGGLGVLGGLGYTPQLLREAITEVKERLDRPSLPFGVDLLLPQLGGSARKTNVDYTKGALDKLIDVVIEEGVKMFVSAVGVPPKSVVNRLHRAGIIYMVCLDLPALF